MTAYEPFESMFTGTPAAPVDNDTAGHSCEICGAIAEDSDLCEACKTTYHSLLESKTFPTPAEAPISVEHHVSPPAAVTARGDCARE